MERPYGLDLDKTVLRTSFIEMTLSNFLTALSCGFFYEKWR